jgi:hypothetical protein
MDDLTFWCGWSLLLVALTITGVGLLQCFFFYDNNDSGALSDVEFILEAARRFNAVREFNETSYNCVNFTNDFNDAMSYFGFDVDYVRRHNWETGHRWSKICLDYDVQKESLVNYWERYPYEYEETR